jgi:hypothetical protein
MKEWAGTVDSEALDTVDSLKLSHLRSLGLCCCHSDFMDKQKETEGARIVAWDFRGWL